MRRNLRAGLVIAGFIVAVPVAAAIGNAISGTPAAANTHSPQAAAQSFTTQPAAVQPVVAAPAPPSPCSQVLTWGSAGGYTDITGVQQAMSALQADATAGNVTAVEGTDAEALDVATTQALADPPPALITAPYAQGMSDYNQASIDLQNGDIADAGSETTSGTAAINTATAALQGCPGY